MTNSNIVITNFNENIEYRLDGLLHREDGPAIEWVNGDKNWYVNGKLHREDGPACEYANGDKVWYQNDQLHREDGPAVKYSDGSKYWYYEGKRINCNSQEEFEKIIKLKIFW